MDIVKKEETKIRAARAFVKKGTCSRTFFYVLNREFGHLKDDEESAIDALAGGILQQGYQCGMLWGASMGLGAEAYRITGNLNDAIYLTIYSTQKVMESFENRTKSIDCSDVTHTDFNNKWSFAKYMLSGKFVSCFYLAGKWGPEAVETSRKALSEEFTASKGLVSCASEVVKKMGGTEEEMAMVAGFAGGMALRGDGCGALGAAIWKTSLNVLKETGKPLPFEPDKNELLNAFYQETEYEMECQQICGKKFNSIEEHSEFIKNGGCEKLINLLSSINV